MFSVFHNHTIALIKENGVTHEGIKANVQSERIFVNVKGNNEFPAIEAGDILEHKQSNGITEQYRVLDPCYYDAQRGVGFGKHYQCKVKKLSSVERQKEKATYNILSNQVNIANDNATIHAVQNNSIDISYIKALIEDVKQSIGDDMPAEDAETVTESLEVLEEQLAQPHPKKSVIKNLLSSIKIVAGTAEFGAAVATLAQYVQSVI